MELKNIVNDIKLYIDSEAVKNKIAQDLGLKFKNNKILRREKLWIIQI